LIGQFNDHALFLMTQTGKKMIAFFQGVLQSSLSGCRRNGFGTAHHATMTGAFLQAWEQAAVAIFL
jgi:hypothetical protein